MNGPAAARTAAAAMAPMSHLSQWRGLVKGMAVSFWEEVRPQWPRAEYARGLSQQALYELRNCETR